MSAAGGLSSDLSLLEIAAGRPVEGARRLSAPPPGEHPRAVLEASVLQAYEAGGVFVSFSGGRDSSLILAVAAHVARREGLPAPVPVTLRHDSPEADETEWQLAVMRHLGLEEWLVFGASDDLDLLGPLATSALTETKIVAPPNAYLHVPMLRRAAGGTLLTGAGGDELLGDRASHLVRWRWGGTGYRRRRVVQSAMLAAAPRRVRASWKRSGLGLPGWLESEAAREVTKALMVERARVETRWDHEAMGWADSRSVMLGNRALTAVAASVGARVLNPLLERDFIAAFAREIGPAGPPDRTASMRLLAADLLPEPVLSRPTKAMFGAMVWGPAFRALVAGSPVDQLPRALQRLVDPVELQLAWDKPLPPPSSMMLAQAAWLSQTSA